VKPPSKLEIFNRKFERAKVYRDSDTSDFEDEDVTLASKFKKNLVGKRKSIDSGPKKKVDNSFKKSVKEEESYSKKVSDSLATARQVKSSQDPEKENQFNRTSDQPSVATTNGKNLSWPEQLARSKAGVNLIKHCVLFPLSLTVEQNMPEHVGLVYYL
jgi:hypothetical protein